MTEDLHSRLVAAVQARMDLAKAAIGPHWISNGGWELRTRPEGHRPNAQPYWMLLARKGEQKYPSPSFGVEFAHIAANDPATVIRHCERDRSVLSRHRESAECLPGHCFWCSEDGLGDGYLVAWPCAEARELAAAYGIEVER